MAKAKVTFELDQNKALQFIEALEEHLGEAQRENNGLMVQMYTCFLAALYNSK